MAFGSKQQEIDSLREELQAAEDARLELEEQLRVAGTSGRIAVAAQTELENAEAAGLIDQEAETAAVVAVVAEEQGRLTDELAEELKRRHYGEFAAQFREKEGPRIREALRRRFERDGTYQQIEARAETDIRADLEAGVLEELMAAARQELSSEEQREAIRAQMRKEMEASTDLRRRRQEVKDELETGWRDEVRAEVHATIREEEAAKEAAFKAQYREDYRKTDDVQRFRKSTRKELEKDWQNKTAEEVLEAVEDEELKELLATRAAQERSKLEQQIHAQELLKDFEGRGVDMTRLNEGARIEIFLGTTKLVVVQAERRNDWKEVVKPAVTELGIACQRKLTLTALGSGRFLVDGDSLLEADSPYIKDDGIHRGTVITIGRKLVEQKKTSLDPRVVADVPLYYDDDTEDSAITDMLLPVADIKIDGLSARNIKHVEMVK